MYSMCAAEAGQSLNANKEWGGGKKQETWNQITQWECALLRSGKDRKYEAWGCGKSHVVWMRC